MIDDAFFQALAMYTRSEQLLERYEKARTARGALTAYDVRALEAERVRNLALLSHAWGRCVAPAHNAHV